MSWEEEPLTLSNESIEGEIPKYLDRGVVQYYVEMEDTDGNQTTVPSDGDRHPFAFYVGELEEVYCNDFEADDGGFTHALLAGEGREGADDWQWGTPNRLGRRP